MACVYENKPLRGLDTLLKPIEQLIYRLCRINPHALMHWKRYATALLIFNGLGLLILYLIQLMQAYLPFNPQQMQSPGALQAFNTAASFVTNTDWQSYSGERSLSYATQMLGLTAQNFMSAATGMSLLIALIRGISSQTSQHIGNFWVDTVRTILYILLPLSILLSLFLVSQGVIQTLKPNQTLHVLGNAAQAHQQIIPMGPVASQVAIKQLGSNGGGFFNANAAHPFENPTPLTNFVELITLLLIPSSLCYTFGVMTKQRRQGWALLVAMLTVFSLFFTAAMLGEQSATMEGKETRFGLTGSVLWSVATTASSNGATNSALDSYTPIARLIFLAMMQLGEIIVGGVGSGLYGMLLMVIVTVFFTGLMVGRTPVYLGKKIEPFEMKMTSLALLITPILILFLTAIASLTSLGRQTIQQQGPYGFTELLYTFTSLTTNNGSALSGLNTSSWFYNGLGSMAMLIGRYSTALFVLAIAGSLGRKQIMANSPASLATDTPLFIMLLIAVMVLLAALSFLPALSLGPIAEQLSLRPAYVN